MKRVTIPFLATTALALWFCQGAARPDELKDDPEAHTLYDGMVKAMRDARSLYYESDYGWEARGKEVGHATLRVWLKKPNQFRVEASRFGSDVIRGVLVGDGEYLWIFWPERDKWEFPEEAAKKYQKYLPPPMSYIKKSAPLGRHSIGHEVGRLGAGISMTILDPSTFHGYTDSLQRYLDGVRRAGVEKVDDEECDVIEVSFMDHQRSWYLWLSKKNHLPRKLKEVVRVSYDIVIHEVWSDIEINGEMSNDKFAWSPPPGWKQWSEPPIQARLLKPGAEAPGFELASLDGETIRLSDFRGSFVWLFKWRVG